MATRTKQAVLQMIKQLPEKVSVEDIMYELYFRQRVDRGLRELEKGRTTPHKEVKRRLAMWLQSTGPNLSSPLLS